MTFAKSPIFLAPNDVPEIEISSASADSMPASNLMTIQPTDKWRSSARNPASVTVDFGKTIDWDFVFLGFTNLTSSARWRVRGYPNTPLYSSTNPNYASPQMEAWLNRTRHGVDYSSFDRVHTWHDADSTRQARYITIDIWDSGVPHIDVGVLRIGKKYQPEFGMLYGSGFPMPTEESQNVKTEGGITHVVERPRPKSYRARFEVEDEDELMSGFFNMARQRGTSEDILAIPYPNSIYAAQTAIYGVADEPIDSSIPEFDTYAISMAIEEML